MSLQFLKKIKRKLSFFIGWILSGILLCENVLAIQGIGNFSSKTEISSTSTHEITTWTRPPFGEVMIDLFIQIIWMLGIILIFFLLLRFIRFLFEISTYKKICYLKVSMPRSDSKLDKERETKKDFKEKIWVMAGIYKSIHGMGKATLKDTFLNFIFDHVKISLELVYNKGNVEFYICTYESFADIIIQQITSYYSDSEVLKIDSKDRVLLKEKDYHIEAASVGKENDDIFPIKTYKYMEDDPLNTFTNIFWGLSPDDKAVYQIIAKPLSNSWNKKAKNAARNFAKGKYKRKWNGWLIMKGIYTILSPISWFFTRFINNESAGGEADGTNAPGASEGDTYKIFSQAEQEAQKMVGEVAGQQAYEASIRILVSSKDKRRAFESVKQIITSTNIYTDEYTNKLDNPQIEDVIRFIFTPLRAIAYRYKLVGFFQSKNVYAIDELLSLYHFPDINYNRSPLISWMDYKKLSCPRAMYQPNKQLILEDFVYDSQWNIKTIDGSKLKTNNNGVIKKTKKGAWQLSDGTILEMGDDEKTKSHPKDKGKLPKKELQPKMLGGFPVYKDASLMGWNEYRNKKTPIYFNKKDRGRHHYVIGKSGGGKSVFVGYMARQDLWNGDGLAVIDPHGDLVEDVIAFTPKHRAKDMYVFDPADFARPMGMNMLEIISDNPDLKAIEKDRAALDATSIFIKIFNEEIFGPRIQHYFRNGCLTLMDDEEEGGTLIDVPRLFTDDAFMKYKTSKVQNPVVKSFWDHEYANTGDREKQEMIPYFSSKFGPFITNTTIRNIIGQPKSAFNVRKIMDEQKCLMVNLSKGKIGDLNAQLLGLIMVSKINMAAMSRADMPEADRKDFFLYVDEFQNFATDTFGEILSEARKYRLALIMAHQFIAQINGGGNKGDKPSIKDAVFGNAGTIMSFKVGAEDAEYLEKEYSPVLSQQDIIGIANFTTYCKLNINNASSRPFDLKTIWDNKGKSDDTVRIIKEYSRRMYGRKKEFVDQEIEARLGIIKEEPKKD